MELKHHLSINEQVSLLASRGLVIENTVEAEAFLEKVNYYRFSGYLHDFRVNHTDKYSEGTSFNQITRIYEFDAKLHELRQVKSPLSCVKHRLHAGP